MPGAMPPAKPPMMANNKMAAGGNFFSSQTPGGGAQTGGYNYALQNLQQALNASNQTTQAGQMQLGQQLQQQQGRLAQDLVSRGLGNSNVATTMQQAPLQTYNLGMAQLGDLSALRQMSAYSNLANMAAQGGNAISGLNQPYAQTQYTKNLMQSMAPPARSYSPSMPSDFSQGAFSSQAQPSDSQTPLYFGQGQAGSQNPYADLMASMAQLQTTQYGGPSDASAYSGD